MLHDKTHFAQVPLADVLEKFEKTTSTKDVATQERGRDQVEKENRTNQPGLRRMTQQFDIFRREPNGGILWRGTASSVEEARSAIATMGASVPGTYLIVNLQTRMQVTVDCSPRTLG